MVMLTRFPRMTRMMIYHSGRRLRRSGSPVVVGASEVRPPHGKVEEQQQHEGSQDAVHRPIV